MNIHYDSFLRRKHFTIIVVVEFDTVFAWALYDIY